MSIPGFTAESSLGPATGTYRTAGIHPGTGGRQVVPMAPCCGIEMQHNLKVTYPHTKCGPLRDFIVATTSGGVFEQAIRAAGPGAARKTGRARSARMALNLGGRSDLDQWVCVTSQGPWDATLFQKWPCSSGPYKQLLINAFGDPVSFVWQGGTEQHPPNVGLVGCRYDHTSRTLCPGSLSTCQCISDACPANQPCTCNLQW